MLFLYIGKRFGRRRWFNNGKSVEGMLVGFFAAASAIFLITSLDRGLAPSSLSKFDPYRLARTLLGLSLSSLLRVYYVKTRQPRTESFLLLAANCCREEAVLLLVLIH